MIDAKQQARVAEQSPLPAVSPHDSDISNREPWDNSQGVVPVIISTDSTPSPDSAPMTSDERLSRHSQRYETLADSDRVDTPRMTPKSGISRESSSTNINSLFMRKIEGLAKASPNRGALSFQSQQRSPNIATKISEDGAGARSYVVTTNDVDRKRLVDQFYNAINESTGGVSSSDLGLKRGQVTPAGVTPVPSSMHSPIAEQTFRFVEQVGEETRTSSLKQGLSSDKLNQVLRNGGFTYNPSSKRMVRDGELTDYMLNIDNISAELSKREFEGLSLLQALVQITGRIAEGVHLAQTPLDDSDGPLQSLADLHQLKQYLTSLRTDTLELTQKLTHNREILRTGYRTDINDSVGRLHELLGELTLLENRLNGIKDKINVDKTVMSQEMLEKLEILELIDNRFTEHSRVTRNRRFKQLNISLTVAVVIVSLYFGFRLR
ncbi:uncharacterized protein CANTADRAFT_20388 [Suhomyces tanzawaensis NRRL Y-17324]|uniref:Uncharacterized protein n=1 Tax=Suhomyces tanzawaensis NRRL Y-17324 TaxID=984487 RepID=A0A1E4SMV1_9ASCO|nr:uncharacterized protein CANTADRAFT_20388 [Suhomyces tanzawaensis NRRL Y-17324]ODV80825.1 hypothetical protein CANTADRAFT_20388 [Suhomyces tanzawaensis NRRL Y-17324]